MKLSNKTKDAIEAWACLFFIMLILVWVLGMSYAALNCLGLIKGV